MSRASRIIGRLKKKLKLEEKEIKYGYYSAEAVNRGHSAIVYTEPRYGNEVLVTVITSDPMARDYVWEDKIFMGPVDKFVRRLPGLEIYLV